MDETKTLEPAKVLARNSACHQCRRRKLKCDAVKPICTNCTKPRVRGVAASAPPEPCTWDDVRDGSSSKRRRSERDDEESESSSRLKELEAKLANFEKAFQAHPLSNRGFPREDPHPNGIAPPASAQWGTFHERSLDWLKGGTMRTTLSTATEDLPASSGPLDSATDFKVADEVPEPTWMKELALSWPDWPRDLPSYEIINHVAQVFFEKVPTVPKMIHKASFFSNLSLPPIHRSFPARPLLHAILAITANHISDDALASRNYFPSGTPSGMYTHPEFDFDQPGSMPRNLASTTHGVGRSIVTGSSTPLARFQLWHRRKAFDATPEYFDQNRQVLQVVQAQCLICQLDQQNAWWVDLWMEAGACVRAAIPLQIHESPKRSKESLRRFSQMLLHEADTAMEQAERDRTWWMVYLTERAVNITTVWTSAIPDQEVTVELPVLQSIFDQGYGELQGTQTVQSPDLYTSHPPLHVDPICLQIKALKLWADINSWFRVYTRGTHSVSKFVNDPQLRLLLSQINAFRLSCPSHLRRPTQAHADSFDVDLIAAHMITYGATIILGEPLIEKESWTHDIARVGLSAVRACLSMLYDITATSFDVTRLPGVCSFVWATCIRALCRFMAAAGETGDELSVAVFQSEIEVFRLALSLYGEKYPLGYRHGKMIDEIFLNKAATELSANLNLGCSAEDIFDKRFRHGKIQVVETLGTTSGNTPASSTSLPTPAATSSTGLRRSVSVSNGGGTTTAETSPASMLATLHSKSTPVVTSNTAWASSSNTDLTTPPIETLANLATAPEKMSWMNGGVLDGALASQDAPQQQQQRQQQQGAAATLAPAAMWTLADFAAVPSQVDAGFDVSSLSFDFDAMAEFFANSNATFNGEDFVFPSQY